MSKLFVQVERVEDLMNRVDDYFTQPKQKPKPITEYDRIVRKSPEELAEWLVAILEHAESDYCGKSCPLYSYCIESNGGMLEWLKMEVE